LLFYFKYTNFFFDLWNDLSFSKASPLNLILPIGISFYTFENLSYTIDVYRGEFKPVRNFLDYLFFLSFFPKLIMGPIVRAADFIPQISKPYTLEPNDFEKGFFLICAGLVKKIVISDYINANFVQYIFDDPSRHTGLECLLAVYGYALVIYCDFSGYSDIAIGLARWTGFRIPDNFNAPYKSTSITEFWRRWHISLSSWLRDYLYIPLGGNRKGKFRTYVNLFVTMVLGGFWHGASWNFLIWGALHGGMLAVDKKRAQWWRPQAKAWKLVGGLLTFHFLCFCWIFFKSDTLQSSMMMLRQIFGNFDAAGIVALLAAYYPVCMMIALGYILHLLPEKLPERMMISQPKRSLAFYVVIFVLVIVICLQVKTSEQIMPVYLQF
jgi:alginate O-acetyltransferase complex protein AlgI